MRRVLLILLSFLVAPSPALATWSVIAVDRTTGRVVIASATCVDRDDMFLPGVQAVVVPGKGVARARRIRDAGYPGDALRELEALDAKAEIAAWRADAAFEKAMKGEAKVEGAERRGDAALLRRLLAEFGDTCLRARIEERLR